MVLKPLAAAGSVSSFVALGLLSSVMLSQNFVVVEIGGNVTLAASKALTGADKAAAQAKAYANGGAGDCQGPNYLGTLGIFQATYDPKCAIGPNNETLSPYNLVKFTTSPTTEFSPLFPAQTLIGGLVNDTFTTCEAFYAPNSKAEVAVSNLVLNSISNGLNGQIVSGQRQIAALTAAIPKVSGGAGALLGVSLSAEVIVAGSIKNTTASFAVGALGLKALTNGLQQMAVNVGGCAASPTQLVTAPYTGCTKLVANGGCPSTNPQVAAACAVLDRFTGATESDKYDSLFLGPFEVIKGDRLSTIGITVLSLDTAKLSALKGLILLDSITGVKTLGDVENGLLLDGIVSSANFTSEGVLTAVKDDFNFTAFKTRLSFAAGSPDLKDFLVTDVRTQLVSAWASYASCTKNTIGECGNVANYALDSSKVDSPGNVKAADLNPTCVLVYAKLAALLRVPAPSVGNCTFLKLTEAIGNPALLILTAGSSPDLKALLASLNANETAAAAAAGASFTALFNYCTVKSLGFDVCGDELVKDTQFPAPGNFVQLPGLPIVFANKYPVCALLPFSGTAARCAGTGNFLDFLDVFRQAALQGVKTSETLGLAGLLVAIGNSTNLGAFSASGAAVAVFKETGFAAANIANNTAQRIADCNNNNKDISAFKTAQAMVTAAAPMMGLGGIIGLVALSLNKGPVAFGAGALSIIGGAVTIGALMVVSGAPVYAKLASPVVPGSPVYKGSTGQLLALLAGAASIIGGIMQLVSGCLGKPSTSDSLTSKVDNSY